MAYWNRLQPLLILWISPMLFQISAANKAFLTVAQGLQSGRNIRYFIASVSLPFVAYFHCSFCSEVLHLFGTLHSWIIWNILLCTSHVNMCIARLMSCSGGRIFWKRTWECACFNQNIVIGIHLNQNILRMGIFNYVCTCSNRKGILSCCCYGNGKRGE